MHLADEAKAGVHARDAQGRCPVNGMTFDMVCAGVLRGIVHSDSRLGGSRSVDARLPAPDNPFRTGWCTTSMPIGLRVILIASVSEPDPGLEGPLADARGKEVPRIPN